MANKLKQATIWTPLLEDLRAPTYLLLKKAHLLLKKAHLLLKKAHLLLIPKKLQAAPPNQLQVIYIQTFHCYIQCKLQ